MWFGFTYSLIDMQCFHAKGVSARKRTIAFRGLRFSFQDV